MKITSEMLSAINKPCAEGLAWFNDQKVKTPKGLLKAAEKDEQKLQWCNWGVARLLRREDQIRYAIYAARKVLHIYEEKYPNDDRPKRAIDAAEKYLNEPTEENKKTADAAYAAAYAAAWAADAEMKIDIISYGIKLLEEQNEN